MPSFIPTRLLLRSVVVTSMLLASMLVSIALAAQGQVDVLTNRYDPQRTGANLNETTLTVANVDVATFGKLYSYPVDGAVYAQPLYVANLAIGGATRNVLYVATMNDKVYAFDADSVSTTPLWMRDLTNPPSVTPVPITDIVAANLNIVGNVGIQGTPVIDRAAGTIYFVARTKESGKSVQRLHALNLATGQPRTGSPVTITATFPGTASDAADGVITFDPKVHVQRAGLALTNGTVLVAWAAHEDISPSHGWIMGFNASTLARTGVLAITPATELGGIWQSGRAPAVDTNGDVYYATGNGGWDGVNDFGNSVLRLRVTASSLSVVDYFTAGNYAALNTGDLDLGGSGFTLIPGTRRLLGGGKEGPLYLLDADNLGHRVTNDTQIPQKIPVQGGHVMGGPVYWNSASLGPLIFNWSEDDVLKAFKFTSNKLALPAFLQGDVDSPGHPGGSLTLSARGSTAGTGIVWASMPTLQDGIHGKVAGTLRAYDAETLRELWHSDQNATRDRVGTLMKFVPPVVVGGKVFLPNQDNQVLVYGLLRSGFALATTPASRTIAPGGSGTFTVMVTPQGSFAGAVALSASVQPSGLSATLDRASIAGGGTATMTVAVPAGASSDTYQITVTGTGGGRTQTSVVSVVVNTATGGAGAIGIDFVGDAPNPMGASEAAGVVSRSHWNSATGAARSLALALDDDSGGSTSASVTWSADGTWMTPIADQAGNARMMKGYLDTDNSSTTTVTVAGLVSKSYDVYVYVDGDNRTYARGATYTVSGGSTPTSSVTLTDGASTNFSGTFKQAVGSTGNYVRFSITGTGFTLSATPSSPATGTRRAPINGIQIVPATAAARSTIGVNFTGTASTPMAAAETAGVIASSRWNNATGASRTTPQPLVDSLGASPGAAITWSANGTWATSTTDTAGNRRMMKGYLDTSNTSSTTLTVSGLEAGAYDVYVYADGDNRSYTRAGTYTISGSGITTASQTLTDPAGTTFAGTFTAGTNYVKFSITGTGFTVTATPASGTNETLRAPINGVQIVPK